MFLHFPFGSVTHVAIEVVVTGTVVVVGPTVVEVTVEGTVDVVDVVPLGAGTEAAAPPGTPQ